MADNEVRNKKLFYLRELVFCTQTHKIINNKVEIVAFSLVLRFSFFIIAS